MRRGLTCPSRAARPTCLLLRVAKCWHATSWTRRATVVAEFENRFACRDARPCKRSSRIFSGQVSSGFFQEQFFNKEFSRSPSLSPFTLGTTVADALVAFFEDSPPACDLSRPAASWVPGMQAICKSHDHSCCRRDRGCEHHGPQRQQHFCPTKRQLGHEGETACCWPLIRIARASWRAARALLHARAKTP